MENEIPYINYLPTKDDNKTVLNFLVENESVNKCF